MSQLKFVTDRHCGIRAMIRDDISFSTVTHYFDIWHLAKSIGKILKELTKLKRNESLIPWKQSIINHFWFSCRNSAGDPQKLIQTFHSFLLHITNSHQPRSSGSTYFNHKHSFSINLMAIVGADYRFIEYDIGSPATMSDSKSG